MSAGAVRVAPLRAAQDKPRGRTVRPGGAAASSLPEAVLAIALIWALGFGWSMRHEKYLTPEEGAGYKLGIIGGVILLMLLLYPLRKKFRSLQALGGMATLFRVHMAMGLVGPTLIMFHSNFSLGSANSAAALVSMLLVVASGVVGRYLYYRTHRGLTARRLAARDLLEEAGQAKSELARLIHWDPRAAQELRSFERVVAEPAIGLGSSLRRAAQLNRRTQAAERALGQLADQMLAQDDLGRRERRRAARRIRHALAEYFGKIRMAARLAVFERLFALWRVVHLPLFAILILTGIVHVIAVHLY